MHGKDETLTKIIERFAGKSFSTLKEKISEELIKTILPIGREVRRMLDDPTYILDVLNEGSVIAQEEAEKNLKELKNIIGLI